MFGIGCVIAYNKLYVVSPSFLTVVSIDGLPPIRRLTLYRMPRHHVIGWWSGVYKIGVINDAQASIFSSSVNSINILPDEVNLHNVTFDDDCA